MQPAQVYVVPKKGLTVRDPIDRAPLPNEGDWKPRDTYWDRRINDGDVIVSEPPKAKKVTKE